MQIMPGNYAKDLDLLRVFVVVADTGSVTSAKLSLMRSHEAHPFRHTALLLSALTFFTLEGAACFSDTEESRANRDRFAASRPAAGRDLTAFTLQPFYERLVERTRRPGLAALACVLASTVGFLGTIGGLSWLFITRGVVMAQWLFTSLAPGGAAREVAQHFADRLGPLHFQRRPRHLSARHLSASSSCRCSTP
jgi:hypothetical protein